MVQKEKMSNGINNIQFLVVASGKFPEIVVMFPRKEERSKWLIKLKTDPKNQASIYPLNEQEAHYTLELCGLLHTENLATQEKFDEGKAKVSCQSVDCKCDC